ncbi:MAG TPA: hypothetical protein DCX32_03635 [Candidatus Moranbacteria bacterium]|nr:MAG: Glycosyl transferase group 1 [Candidatus Moranbacteria bacterium GW2011_GWC2_45_10]KKT94293.1 MAG: Glycosyl transferase group 1 [Parcubacteria group bacterium GW2011_GWC1_45_14]HAV11607.1 hypothetical protein [Candidatus Moranbacteria bacterium]
MRIGIDARTILSPEKGDAIGAGHYTYQLIRHLLKIDQKNEYVLFFDFRVREKDIKKFTKPNVKIKFYPFSDYKKYLPGMYNEILGTATLQRENLDVLHSTSYSSRIPTGYQGKTIVTFQDMIMYHAPQYLPQVKRLREKTVAKLMAKKADKIIASSNSLKDELNRYLGVPEERVEVIYSGLDKRFFETPDVDAKKVLEKFGINGKYILFLGTLEPSKNITRMLQAFAKLKEEYKNSGNKKFEYQLVLAGKKGWLSEEYIQIIKDLGLSKDIVFTGYIIGDELVPLFKNSEFFIMPSLYEGFGMTVLEAFATKTPAIISNVSSLPEIAKDGALYVNPLSVDEIKDAMKKFIEDGNLRSTYKEKGFAIAQKFDWDETAKKTLEIYESLK